VLEGSPSSGRAPCPCLDAHGFSLSPLEEQRFGVRTTRVASLERAAIPALLDFCRANHVRLVIARCASEDLATAQAFEEVGGRLMATLVYYLSEFRRAPQADFATATRIRTVRAEEVDDVCSIAAHSFQGYRGHYHADARLDRAKCDEVYPSWVRRSVMERSVA